MNTIKEQPMFPLKGRSAWVLGLTLTLAAVAPVRAQGEKAILKFNRADRLISSAYSMQIYINDENVGSVANGTTKTFEFSPKPGKNKVYGKLAGNLTEVIEVECLPGGVVTAKTGNPISLSFFEMKWAMTGTVENPKGSSSEELPPATLKVDQSRDKSSASFESRYYVNGKFVGSVFPGQTKEFAFVPSSDSKNQVCTKYNGGGGKEFAKESSHEAGWGGIIEIKYEYDGNKLVEWSEKVVHSGLKIESVVLDKTQKHVEIKESATIRQATTAIKREEYTVKHSVTIQEATKFEANFGLKLWVFEGGVRMAFENSTGHTYEKSKTTIREVTIPGDGKAYRMVWIETYRTGRVIAYINGKRQEIPFEFRDGWDLQTREVKE